jgi:hypothetical protein
MGHFGNKLSIPGNIKKGLQMHEWYGNAWNATAMQENVWCENHLNTIALGCACSQFTTLFKENINMTRLSIIVKPMNNNY